MPQWPTLKNRATPAPDANRNVTTDNPDDRELVIGKSLRFRGDLEVLAHLRIEGTVRGCIHASIFDVVIEKDGVAAANVHAGDVVVRGKVIGAIIAEGTVKLESTAEVHGPIHAARVVLEEGCLLAGRVDVDTDPTRSEATQAEPLISHRGGHRDRIRPSVADDLRSMHD